MDVVKVELQQVFAVSGGVATGGAPGEGYTDSDVSYGRGGDVDDWDD